jgi:hypothetical protein
LDHEDVLLLFTDGIEESKRKFRNTDFKEIMCTVGDPGTPHDNHISGQRGEELGYERIEDIINAVMNKKIYKLHKFHDGEGEDKVLQFDFRYSKGTVKDIILALISVEKIFRFYYDPKATEENRVPVDRIVDVFLREYFLQYRDYCAFIQKHPDNPEYMYYTNVMEDEQYDDLTILGIKRK